MLIEFKVENFRSIREEQKFSLVAKNTDKALTSCLIRDELPGLSGLKYLKGAAIYGANASGKSNFFLALHFVSDFIENSATGRNPGDRTGAQPFKLDQHSAARPSKFEVTFVADGVRYLFGFSVTSRRVVEEYLVAYPKGIPQKWYERVFDDSQQRYFWSRSSSAFKQDRALQEKTRENSLFLSVGPQFNHPQLTPVFKWFTNHLRFINLSAEWHFAPVYTASRLSLDRSFTKLLNLLRSADIGVTHATIKEKDIPEELIRMVLSSSEVADGEKVKRLKEAKAVEINFLHKGDGVDPVSFDFENEESAGTRRFFALIGPWIDILENGYTVFIDEIETSLHPILVRQLVKLLLSDKNNPKGAQIIFTTHNPILLDTSLLRRDQIWFTEKLQTGATRLYPLTDYQPRNNEALAKGYLAGRYGAIPFLPEGLKL